MSQNKTKNEEILKNNCDKAVSAIEAMIYAKRYEDHHNDDVKKQARKICKEAHNLLRDTLVKLIKSASDTDFVLKDVEIRDDDDFKFLKF